ncbi:hypothetical protein F2Q65_00100 [Thiohalocapsa marina]|uniref:Uncharacterized protein n=1 Tax=Thiohalocapsa marina TaxID=424902 RepID=A0A5M8FV60_9GAMM|nr:hypothetical protein [Thiohalocapsa marina]KAA6187686.1 hypothetical protein F2Q65_00100 [Thiohalocapsa marina]
MSEKRHWLYRKENLPKLWALQILILALALAPEFFIQHHAHVAGSDFRLDTGFGFFAWYGFVTCALMVVGAKLLGIFLKREDTYYDD